MPSLVVFDYDWSLINENSDTFIFDQLFPDMNPSLRELSKHMPWTSAVDEALKQLHIHHPEIQPQHINELMGKIPIQDQMIRAIHFLKEQGSDIKILSDANTIYIDAFVNYHDLQSHFSEIVTNFGEFNENGRLRVRPYHSRDNDPHGCDFCPPNLCKGRVLDRFRRSRKDYTKILYIGDGSGDFCPSIRMKGPNDIVFARKDPTKTFGLTKRIEQHPDLVTAHVIEWSTGDDLFNALKNTIQ